MRLFRWKGKDTRPPRLTPDEIIDIIGTDRETPLTSMKVLILIPGEGGDNIIMFPLTKAAYIILKEDYYPNFPVSELGAATEKFIHPLTAEGLGEITGHLLREEAERIKASKGGNTP